MNNESNDDQSDCLQISNIWDELPSKTRHALRNELHIIRVGVHLLREQTKEGLTPDSEKTFTLIADALQRLDS